MICANKVLPRYMAIRWRHPERLCKPPFPIQVGDALCHPKSPAAIGFLTNTSQVNRTVLRSEYFLRSSGFVFRVGVSAGQSRSWPFAVAVRTGPELRWLSQVQ